MENGHWKTSVHVPSVVWSGLRHWCSGRPPGDCSLASSCRFQSRAVHSNTSFRSAELWPDTSSRYSSDHSTLHTWATHRCLRWYFINRQPQHVACLTNTPVSGQLINGRPQHFAHPINTQVSQASLSIGGQNSWHTWQTHVSQVSLSTDGQRTLHTWPTHVSQVSYQQATTAGSICLTNTRMSGPFTNGRPQDFAQLTSTRV